MNKVASPNLVGFVNDTGFVLQDELDVGRRTSLDKFNEYIWYGSICGLLRNNDSYIPFK